MDSKDRHELKQNDLAHLLETSAQKWNDREWWATWGNRTLLVLLLLSAAVLVYVWTSKRAANTREMMLVEFANATSPEAFDSLAAEYSDPAFKARALLYSADLLAQRATGVDATSSMFAATAQNQPESTEESRKADAQNAILRYQEVLAVRQASPLIHFNAMLGKANAHEMLGQWEEAKALYEKVIADAGQDAPALSVRARNRLTILPRLNEPIVFSPEPASSEPAAAAGAPAPLPGLGTLPLPADLSQPRDTSAAPAPAAASPAPATTAQQEAVPDANTQQPAAPQASEPQP